MLLFQGAFYFLSVASLFQTIPGRDEVDLYRVKTPEICTAVQNNDLPLQDTRTPIKEFLIKDARGDIKITIHNFPSEKLEDRIPPIAQVKRWEKQFDTIDPRYQRITPQSFSGFTGLLYEGKGSIKGEEKALMAWAMQLGSEHYRTLSRNPFSIQKRSDFTIKAIGPSAAIDAHREQIFLFARSFELLDEIPSE